MIEIVRARQQNTWKLPAVINFTLGSMGAGYYLLTLIESLVDGSAGRGNGIPDGLIALAFIFTGFFALVFEAGNPLKSYLTILNVRHSWMSRELMFAILFMGFIGLDWLAPGGLWRGGAGLMAFMFIVSQAFIVYKSRAILSWNVWPVPPLFIFSGMASGFGPYLLLRMTQGVGLPMVLVGICLLLLCLSLLLYYLFAFRRAETEFQAATRFLRTRWSLGVGVVMGLIGPLVLLLIAGISSSPQMAGRLYAVVGTCVIVGTWKRNRDLITRAGYFRRIEIRM